MNPVDLELLGGAYSSILASASLDSSQASVNFGKRLMKISVNLLKLGDLIICWT